LQLHRSKIQVTGPNSKAADGKHYSPQYEATLPTHFFAQAVTNKCSPARLLDNEESETSAQKDGSWIASELFMIDSRYETEHRLVWNDEKRTNEEHTFVYEVSWIPEVGV
jgi:hypothetical protein